MTKIHVLSDLHLEFGSFSPPKTDADVVVLAGDIALGAKGVDWAHETFPDKPVILLAGNHEAYWRNLQSTIAGLRERSRAHEHIHFLENDEVVLGSLRILGATLWTDFNLFDSPTAAMYHALGMNDFRIIRYTDGGQERTFTPFDSLELHETSRAWLTAKLAEPFAGKTLVVSHHCPHKLSVAPRWRKSPLTPAFTSDLSSLLAPPVKAWLHGHTHDSHRYVVNGVQVICNPRGYYPHELNPDFDPDLVIEI